MKTIGFPFALLALVAVEVSAATVSGSVSFSSGRGQKPNPAETVIWLEPAVSVKVRGESAQMVTRNKRLWPHVMAVPAGSTIQFPNEDPITHNLFSISPANPFDLGLYKKNSGKSEKFERAGIVTVYCNVHPNMSAVIHVMDTPYYVMANSQGAFSLSDVPAGRYKLSAWNEKSGLHTSSIEVAASGEVRGKTALTLDARNYRATQHLNKNNQPYSRSRSNDY